MQSRENPYSRRMTDIKPAMTPKPLAHDAPLRTSPERVASQPARSKSSVLVPIRSLGANHRGRIARHLMALESRDRYLRFGFMANDDQIQRYADSLNFERDEIFGIYNRRIELIAMAHLAFSADGDLNACAEFGVSVLSSARGRGYGGRLFERASMHARNEGVSTMLIHALSENTTMLKIARNAGASVKRDGSESEAHLLLLPATLDTRLTEIFHEQLALTDYRIKVQVKQFRDLITGAPAYQGDQPAPLPITPE
jgi:GNAT superfamily N-acetyltransferase